MAKKIFFNIIEELPWCEKRVLSCIASVTDVENSSVFKEEVNEASAFNDEVLNLKKSKISKGGECFGVHLYVLVIC